MTIIDRARNAALAVVDFAADRVAQLAADRVAEKVSTRNAELAEQVSASNAELAQRLHDDIAALVKLETERVVREIQDVEFRSRRDIGAAAERDAVSSTERFVLEHLPKAKTFDNAEDTLRYALSFAPDEGMALEFGVYSGKTLRTIAEVLDGRDVFGFDSFEGLPEDWRTNFPAGTFAVDGLPDVPGAELVVGWFDETLPAFVEQHPDPVAFLHLDADLYSSTKTALDFVGSRLRPGSVVVFDEYFNYPGWEQHEHKAWTEFVERTGITFEYLAYTVNFEQLAVRITG